MVRKRERVEACGRSKPAGREVSVFAEQSTSFIRNACEFEENGAMNPSLIVFAQCSRVA
jgi:hypothetical protein